MRAAVAGFVSGVLWLQFQPELPVPLVLTCLFAGVLLACCLAWRWRLVKAGFGSHRVLLRCVAGALFGACWASLFAWQALQHELPREWEGRDVMLVGTIDSLPYRFEQGVRFQFALERAFDGEAEIADMPPRVSLSWQNSYGSDAAAPVPEVRPGERWRLTARLKRPHGNANPYGFDYEAWLLGQNLRATGYVRANDKVLQPNQRLDAFVFGVGNTIERTRGWLRDRIVAALPDKPYAAVIVALVVGDQRGIGQSDWAVFNRTGISHLISISGLHITMLAGMVAGLTMALWRRSFFTRAQLPLLLPAQKAAALAGALTALIYVALAGFGVPAQRTLYMLTVVALALWFGRITQVSQVLAIALGVTVLFDPWAVLWPGFWLSFGAVAVILYASVGRATRPEGDDLPRSRRWLAELRAAARTQYAVTLGLVPLTMLLFGQMSLISPLANAVAIPLVSLIVTPLALLGSVLPAPLSGWLLSGAHALIDWLAVVLGWMSRFEFAVWSAPLPSAWVFGFALAGTIWMLAPRGWPVRWLGVPCWLPLLLGAPTQPLPGEMRVVAFDVGQGSALLVETHAHRLLVDAGPAYSPESDGGNRVILPYMKGRGINALDMMLITHADSDHAGGALSVLKETAVGEVLSSIPDSHEIARAARKFSRCEAGQSWVWDGVRFEVLQPEAASYASTKWKSNDRSCVLKITAGTHSMLLPGDIGWVQEDELLGSQGSRLRSTVLLASHHGGSKTSTLPFVQAVQPQWVLFQSGYRNRYGHPKPEVLQRVEAVGARRLRTDESGAITLDFGQTLRIDAYRQSHARYWQVRHPR
ncbi:MAG: internalization-related competence protein ComEC/Rec2 [Burkholderiaceae bacterium]|nr:internalization-related competence protein ComEC/Rec2 [Burkholderiaceae bacterium]